MKGVVYKKNVILGYSRITCHFLFRLSTFAIEKNKKIVVTSGIDGKHREGSKHTDCKAWDIRRWNLRKKTMIELMEYLYRLGFSVLLEKTHIHVSWKEIFKNGKRRMGW